MVDSYPINIPENTYVLFLYLYLISDTVLPHDTYFPRHDYITVCPSYRNSIQVYSYGAPRVGNPAFAQLFDSLIPDCYRVVNDQDIVGKYMSIYVCTVCGSGTVVSYS